MTLLDAVDDIIAGETALKMHRAVGQNGENVAIIVCKDFMAEKMEELVHGVSELLETGRLPETATDSNSNRASRRQKRKGKQFWDL